MITGNNDKISVQGSIFTIIAFSCSAGDVETQDIDLTSYQGQMVRVYLDKNLRLQINPREDMFWQLAEMQLPYITAENNTLYLDDVDIKVFENPE